MNVISIVTVIIDKSMNQDYNNIHYLSMVSVHFSGFELSVVMMGPLMTLCNVACSNKA